MRYIWIACIALAISCKAEPEAPVVEGKANNITAGDDTSKSLFDDNKVTVGAEATPDPVTSTTPVITGAPTTDGSTYTDPVVVDDLLPTGPIAGSTFGSDTDITIGGSGGLGSSIGSGGILDSLGSIGSGGILDGLGSIGSGGILDGLGSIGSGGILDSLGSGPLGGLGGGSGIGSGALCDSTDRALLQIGCNFLNR